MNVLEDISASVSTSSKPSASNLSIIELMLQHTTISDR